MKEKLKVVKILEKEKRIPICETKNLLGQKVKVAGWVNTKRSHGKIIFVDLRDFTGILQLVFTQEDLRIYRFGQEIKPEWVIEVEGQIQKRLPQMINPKIETGEIELRVQRVHILSRAKTLPFPITTPGYEISEDIRMKYRYLDLRRERLRKNLRIRQKLLNLIRDFMNRENFLEVETPILTKSTPEGARDFLVPSRLHPGKFYALPQSPQQYKQLLQVAGIEKYFQIAKCFRDEDPRADRQPEFTQLDIEMSFIDQEDILNLVERLLIFLVENIFPQKTISQIPFPRLPYHQSIKKYKTDKPDLRKEIDGKKDPDELAFVFIVDFPMFEWKEGERRWDTFHHPFTKIQPPKFLVSEGKLKDEEKFIHYLKTNPHKLLAFQYDVVLNGIEIGGGSLRETNPKILEAVFEVLGHKKEKIREKFFHLFSAFEFGVPPHGGIALGIDRILAILLNEPSIREVIAFPKTGDFRDLMMDLPSEVEKEQLEELNIEIRKPEK